MSATADLDQKIAEAVDKVLDAKLRQIIREEITAAAPHRCRFSMSDPEAQSMSKYVKSISRLGGDDIDDGLELIRENHKWIANMRQGGSKAASAFFMLLMASAAGAFLTLLWEGFKARVVK